MNTLTVTQPVRRQHLSALPSPRLDNVVVAQEFKQPLLFQGIIEGLVDGILILTRRGERVHDNEAARQICRQLMPDAAHPTALPDEIRHLYKTLIESVELFPAQKTVLEDEIVFDSSVAFRLRVQWLKLMEAEPPLILVTLEDCRRSQQSKLFSDAQKYGLTPRETEIWQLYRSNQTYKQIGAKLFVTINTVKKHMKSIHAKRKSLCLVD